MATLQQTPEPSLDILTVTAGDLRQLLDCGKCTSVELVQLYLAQIARHNHAGMKLHAITTKAPVQMLLEEARALDLERQCQVATPWNPPNDFFLTPSFGLGTTCGSFALKGVHASEDVAVATSLRDAGCIEIALANLSEWADCRGANLTSGWFAVGGQTQTPYVLKSVDPNDKWLGHSTPGGSSSGSAVGTAAGFSAFSIGSESDGSIMQPAIRAAL
ncbi:Amidase signature domain protein [Metarhizium guizhouense ARSEF 977]|uniref:Amidase signature domain protein n=1 Tax=Metarhizium guizhouense (strain ARSEF 977) TaxID=1276136 RepID=A0A0B4GU65_METGA|nr:Amidase signature domain protein [Metarhizium guizhouense ARSEF 977]